MEKPVQKVTWADVREYFKYDSPPFFRVGLSTTEIKELDAKGREEIKALVTKELTGE